MRFASLALVTALLLSGCTLPPQVDPPLGSGRMVARGPDDTLARLSALSYQDAAALTALNASDNAGATFKLDVADFQAGAPDASVKDVVYADYLTALSRAQAAGIGDVLPSVNLIDGLAKQINDGVYARLELIEEQDHKAALRDELYQAFRAAYDAHPGDADWQKLVVHAAASLELAGAKPSLTPALQSAVTAELADFAANPVESKPIGFYTLNDKLSQIFQADRELHRNVALVDESGQPIDPALREAALAGSVMASDTALAQAYDNVSTFYQKMSNPLDAFSPTAIASLKPDSSSWSDLAGQATARQALYAKLEGALEDGMNSNFSLFPGSRSVETTLFSKEQAPDGDLMSLLIGALRSGQVTMKPSADSGFYQYQEYALQALLEPDKDLEGTKVTFGDKYLKRLEEAFKTGLTKARETQVKQMGPGPEATAVILHVQPKLFVEPIITVYKRYGDMYDFLERSVLPLFNADELKAKPLTEAGDGPDDLVTTVAKTKRLMYGLYLVGAAELGITKPESIPLDDATQAQAIAEAKDWLAHLPSDPRLAMDTRVSVPITIYEEGGQKYIRFWGTAGVTLVKIQVNYLDTPDAIHGEPEAATYYVPADKFVTFSRPYDKGVLTRSEYRHILDTSTTWDAALRRLEGQ